MSPTVLISSKIFFYTSKIPDEMTSPLFLLTVNGEQTESFTFWCFLGNSCFRTDLNKIFNCAQKIPTFLRLIIHTSVLMLLFPKISEMISTMSQTVLRSTKISHLM